MTVLSIARRYLLFARLNKKYYPNAPGTVLGLLAAKQIVKKFKRHTVLTQKIKNYITFV